MVILIAENKQQFMGAQWGFLRWVFEKPSLVVFTRGQGFAFKYMLAETHASVNSVVVNGMLGDTNGAG